AHVECQPMMVRRVRTGTVDTPLGEDDETSRLHRQFDAVFNLFIEVERVSRLVEPFFATKGDRANPTMRAAGEPQAATFRGGIIDGGPDRELKDFAAIRRENAGVLVVFHHECAGLMPLN